MCAEYCAEPIYIKKSHWYVPLQTLKQVNRDILYKKDICSYKFLYQGIYNNTVSALFAVSC